MEYILELSEEEKGMLIKHIESRLEHVKKVNSDLERQLECAFTEELQVLYSDFKKHEDFLFNLIHSGRIKLKMQDI